MMASLGEALQDEIKRVSALRDEYLLLPGNAGIVGAALMRHSLDRAIKALADADCLECICCYDVLKGYTG